MPITRQAPVLTSNYNVVRDADADATLEADAGPGGITLYELQIDNSANTAAASFVKIWNALTATVGTTAPDLIFRVPAAATLKLAIPEGLALGTGFSFACVTAGGTAGTTGPTSDVSLIAGFSQP